MPAVAATLIEPHAALTPPCAPVPAPGPSAIPPIDVLFLAVGANPQLSRAGGTARSVDAHVGRPSPVRYHLLVDAPSQHPLTSNAAWRPFAGRVFVHSTACLSAAGAALHRRLSTTATGPGAVYLYKPLLHLLLPAWLPKVLVLDADVFVVADVRRLWAEFDRFGPAACAGLAVEQAPSYAHVRARGGLNFNGGVQLLDLDRMRSSARYAARLADAADGRLPGLKADEKRIGFLGDQTLYSLMTVAPAANGTGDGRGLFHALPCGWNRQTGTHMAGWPGFWAAHACHERCGLLHFNFAGHKALAEALKAEAAAGGEWRAACRAVFDRARRTDPLFRNGSADARMLGEVSGCCVAE